MNGKRWAALGIAAVLLFFSIASILMRTFINEDFQKSMEDFRIRQTDLWQKR